MNATISIASGSETGLGAGKRAGSNLKRIMIAHLLVALCCIAKAQAAPTITGLLVNGVVSNTGPVGATLTIQGTGFGASIGFSTATLNGIALAGPGEAAVSWTNTAIVAVIPETVSSGPVIVTVGGVSSNSVSFFIGALITQVSPTSALAGTGVIIGGQGFGTSGGTVTFNGVSAVTTGWADTDIAATVPTGATAGPIVVNVSGQLSNGWPFTPTPSISSLSSNFGVAGTAVTISGDSFGNSQVSGSTVTFDGVPATVSKWTNTSIIATAPSGATTGYVVVSVNGVPSAGIMFTYTPSITSLSPIPVLADGLITIGGTNFGSPLSTDVVTFDGTTATVNSWSNTSIVAVVPGNVAAGTVVVSVNGVDSNAFSFALTSPYTFSVSYAPNGDVLSANDNVNGNWVYAYDGFNRLTCSNLSSNGSCSSPTSGSVTYTYAYDRYGNRWQQNGPSTMLLTFNNSQNRMDSYSYDAAGNLLNDGFHTYTYDAENRIIEVDSGQTAAYNYDGDGERIQKTVGSVVAQYLHDLSGNTITELNSSGVWTRSEIYAGGRHLATYGGGSSGATYFVQNDWLGTERARVLPDGDLAETCTSLPFGDGQTCTGAADPTPNHFTGKQRDTESNLDNFGARYYASTMGRFITPDWAARATAVPYAVFGDPQTLNLYTYVENGPLNRVDADGHGGNGGGTAGNCSLQSSDSACNRQNQGVKANPAQNKKDPPAPKKGFAVLPTIAGAVDLGVGKAGATAQGSATATVPLPFVDKTLHPHLGVEASGSLDAYAGQHTAAQPKQDKDSFVFGAFAGVGAGPTFTNAGNAPAMKSMTNTLNVDLGLGPAASISVSSGPSGVSSFTITFGWGYGAAVTETNTATATAPSQ